MPQSFDGIEPPRLARRHVAKNNANTTVAPSVRSNLLTILGRTAAYKNGEVTWAEVLKANQKTEVDLKGLKS